MSWQDIVNGLYELLGAPFICMSIFKLYREKQVRGVSWIHAGFFASWGFWNLYYYPHLGQWCSFVGGLAIVTANTVWLCQLIYYTRKQSNQLLHQRQTTVDVEKPVGQ